MKKFKDVRTGVIETVTNKVLIEQYEKHNDIYEEIKDKKVENSNVTPTPDDGYTKKLEVRYGNKTLADGSKTVVKAGDTIVIKATPANKVSKIWYNWNNEGKKSVTADTLNFKLPTTLKAGTYKLLVNAIYTDGLYVDGKDANSTNSKVYTFVIEDSSKPSNNRELDIEPWMEENDSTEELCISLRNDSEEENKANKEKKEIKKEKNTSNEYHTFNYYYYYNLFIDA